MQYTVVAGARDAHLARLEEMRQSASAEAAAAAAAHAAEVKEMRTVQMTLGGRSRRAGAALLYQMIQLWSHRIMAPAMRHWARAIVGRDAVVGSLVFRTLLVR